MANRMILNETAWFGRGAVGALTDEVKRRGYQKALIDRHGTSRVLFRNTRNGVKGFPKRELHTIKLPLPTQYQTAIKVSGIMGARKSAEDQFHVAAPVKRPRSSPAPHTASARMLATINPRADGGHTDV